MKVVLLPFCLLFISWQTLAQHVSNVASTQQGRNAVITYDLKGKEHFYFIKLLYSADGGQTFSKELNYVSGDVKSGITAGKGKKIVWMPEKEVQSLIGPVVFKVEAEPNNTLSLPKSLTLGDYTVEIIKVKHIGIELTLELLFTQNTNEEVKLCSLLKKSELTEVDGRKYTVNSGVWGKGVIGSSNSDIKCYRDVPVKAHLSFLVENFDKLIPILKLSFNPSSNIPTFVFNNIPVE